MFDVSSELSRSQERTEGPLLFGYQCVLVSMSLRADTLTVRMSAAVTLIGPLCDLQSTLMTERGEVGWVHPAPAYCQGKVFLNIVFRSLLSK